MKQIRIWDVASGKLACKIKCKGLAHGLAWAPDGKGGHAILCSDKKGVALYSPDSGKPLGPAWGSKQAVWAVAVDPARKLVAAGGLSSKVHLLELETLKEVETLEGHTANITSLMFTKDGLVSGSL